MASKKKIIGSGVDVQTAAGVSALTVDETTGAVTVGVSGTSASFSGVRNDGNVITSTIYSGSSATSSVTVTTNVPSNETGIYNIIVYAVAGGVGVRIGNLLWGFLSGNSITTTQGSVGASMTISTSTSSNKITVTTAVSGASSMSVRIHVVGTVG